MQSLLHIALGNAVVAGGMALLLLPAARWIGRPALTHALSLLILLKLVTPPLVNVPLNWPERPAAVPVAQVTRAALPRPSEQALDLSQPVEILVPAESVATPPTPAPVSRPWATAWGYVLGVLTSPLTAAAWAGSSALYTAVVLMRIVRLRRAVGGATVPGEDLSQEVSRLSRQLGLGVAPDVRFVSGVAPPMLLAAFVKARVLIPAALWSRLDESKRQTLLLHELAHLRRRDHWVRYLELAATCLYWWHPAVWWARAALREAEEQCCDAWVIWAMPAARRAYMTTLLDAVDFISESVRPNSLAAPMLASGMGQFQHLQRRLTMVRERSVQRRLSGGGLAAVVLSAIALPLGPRLVRGDDAPPAPPAADRPVPVVDAKPDAPPAGDGQAPAEPAKPDAPVSVSQAPAVEEKPEPVDPNGQALEAKKLYERQTLEAKKLFEAADKADSDPRVAPRPETADPYAKSAMSRTESLDEQLRAAHKQIEDLQQQLAASKGKGPGMTIGRPDRTFLGVQPPRAIAVDPLAPVTVAPAPPALLAPPTALVPTTPPVPPAPSAKVAIRYDKGKLVAVTIPDEKVMWMTDIGPLVKIESVDSAKIIVQGANDKLYVVAVRDGRILENKAIVVVPEANIGAIGVTPSNVFAKPETGNKATQTEKRLDSMEQQLNRLNDAVDRLTKMEFKRGAAGDAALREAEKMRAIEAEERALAAQTEAKLRQAGEAEKARDSAEVQRQKAETAEDEARLRQADRKLEEHRAAKQKDGDNPTPKEQLK